MIGLLQRVLEASVSVVEGDSSRQVACIEAGLVVLVGVQHEDSEQEAELLARRLLNYRVFDDGDGRMNLDVGQAGGSLLLVSQFTLAADTRKGRRPGFSTAAEPERAELLFDYFVAAVRRCHPSAQTGCFGAHMRVALINDGPVTFRLEVAPSSS
jgi:D-tyrosyl-tRNA(Tyr) deacylase